MMFIAKPIDTITTIKVIILVITLMVHVQAAIVIIA